MSVILNEKGKKLVVWVDGQRWSISFLPTVDMWYVTDLPRIHWVRRPNLGLDFSTAFKNSFSKSPGLPLSAFLWLRGWNVMRNSFAHCVSIALICTYKLYCSFSINLFSILTVTIYSVCSFQSGVLLYLNLHFISFNTSAVSHILIFVKL